MQGCDYKAIGLIRRTSTGRIGTLLKKEGPKRVLLKSLLNLLYNAIVVGSIPVSRIQKKILDDNREVVWQLLSHKTSLAWKKRLLIRHPDLVVTIAALCPADGL